MNDETGHSARPPGARKRKVVAVPEVIWAPRRWAG